MALSSTSRNANTFAGIRSALHTKPHLIRYITTLLIRFLRRPLQRRIICFAIAFNLLLWPGPGIASHYLVDAITQGATTLFDARLLSSSYEAYFIKRLLTRTAQTPHRDTPSDRIAVVAHLQLSPSRLVRYLNQTLVFTALPTDSFDRTIQGVPLTWESSNPDKVQIDETGRATCLQPGLARITCRAGAVSATAPMLVRPIRRPVQSDAEWRADQGTLRPDGTVRGMNGSSVKELLASLADKISPPRPL